MMLRRLAALATLALGAASAHAADFVDGDLYLYTRGWPSIGSAVARIDPVTGDTDVILEMPTLTPWIDYATYDPYRDRLVVMPDIYNSFFRLVAADGSYTDLANPWDPDIVAWAPTGDGRLYIVAGIGYVAYFDAADQLHVLRDIDGVTPFLLSFFVTDHQLIYDVGTNSLFLMHWGNASQVAKIPLSADGSQVIGPVEIVEFDACELYAEESEGISAGPNGTIFLKMRVPSNEPELLMFTIDPVTLTFTPFATIQHTMSAWNCPATYNSVTGLAYAVDTWNDHVRTYTNGGVQAGAIHCSGVSDSHVGEGHIISIGDTINGTPLPSCGDADGDNQVGVTDLLALLAAWGVCPGCPEDFNGDGVVNVNDLLFLLGSWGAC